MDIHKDPMHDDVRTRLHAEGYPVTRFRTISDVLDFFVFALCVNVTIGYEKRVYGKTEEYIIRLNRLDVENHKRDIGYYATEEEAWKQGMLQSVRWIHSNINTVGRYGRPDIVYTFLFGNLDKETLENLKTLVSSQSPTTKSITVSGVITPIDMAKRLITYCERMLGLTALDAPITAVVLENVSSPDSVTITADPSPDRSSWIIDDTVPGVTLGTTTTASSPVYTVVDPIVTSTDVIWHRDDIIANYGYSFVEYIETFHSNGTQITGMLQSQVTNLYNDYEAWLEDAEGESDEPDEEEYDNGEEEEETGEPTNVEDMDLG